MKILITGGVGFVGINLARKLLNSGHSLTLIDNLITSEKSKLRLIPKTSKWKFVNWDICKKLPNAIINENFDQIYHLACPTGVPNLSRLAEEMLLTCSTGTVNILELARKNNAPILFTSSSEIYGDPLIFPQSESYTGNVDPTGPRSAYEEGKRFSESLCVMYKNKYNLRVFIVRLFNTYGPAMSLSDSRVIPNMLMAAAGNRDITVQGKGAQTRTFCFAEDLVEALTTVMRKGKSGEVYNAGNNEEISIINLAKLILKITGSKSKITRIDRPVHDHNRRLPNLSKIQGLGWRNKVPLEKGLALTYSSIK